RPIEVPDVAGHVLVVPHERARLGIERDSAVRVERVRPLVRLLRRKQDQGVIGLTDADVEKARVGIVGWRRPDRAAETLLQRRAVPAVPAGLSGARYGVETPEPLAGGGVQGDEETAPRLVDRLAAGDALKHLAVGDQWPGGDLHLVLGRVE